MAKTIFTMNVTEKEKDCHPKKQHSKCDSKWLTSIVIIELLISKIRFVIFNLFVWI